MDYDLVVVGGGVAGLGAARAAARRGARTLLVSAGPPGGDCTFTGCVPSKTLIETAVAGLSPAAAMRRVRRSIATVAASETAEVLRGEGIEVVDGRARLLGGGRVEVDGSGLAASRVVLATGSRPAVPPVPGLSDADFLTNETVFDLAEPPTSLTVLGGGATGCELAQAFHRLGVAVTVVEAADRLLPAEDAHASAVIAHQFTAEGITVHTGQPVRRVEASRLSLADGTLVAAERILVAAGRVPGTDGLGLSAAGVAVDEHGYVRTDSRLATSVSGVYAAGDVTGRLMFTHAADAMGRIAAGNALSRRRRRFRADTIPHVVFTDPEVAQVGLTRAQAVDRSATVAFLPMREVDRAVTAERTEGFVTLITGPAPVTRRWGGGRVLGATIVAPRAGEMIGEIALAMRTRAFAGRLAQTTHAYPTWSHAVQLAAAQLFGYGTRRPHPACAVPPDAVEERPPGARR